MSDAPQNGVAQSALPQTAAAFPAAFAAAFVSRDAGAVAALFSDDADVMTLTGDWCEGRTAIEKAHRAAFQGMLARARLVTGRLRMRALGPFAAVFSQRFVVTALCGPDGRDAGHAPAVFSAALICTDSGWLAIQAQFTADAAKPGSD